LAVEVPAEGVAPVSFKLLELPPPAGVLVVRANLDGALVRVDGKEMGFTPGVIDNVAAGTHKVEALAEGRQPVVETLAGRRDGRSFLDVKLRYAVPRVVGAEEWLTRAQDVTDAVPVISSE